jgi:hypothetical protein
MSEIEMAQEDIEHAAHEHAHGGVPHAKKAAIVIATLAACLAICETAEGRPDGRPHPSHRGLRHLGPIPRQGGQASHFQHRG